jgi:hypothetical protein
MTKEYYEQHKEERRAYQREYARKKFGFKPQAEKPRKSEEQKKAERNARAKKYYHEHQEKCRGYGKKYYWENREYYLEKSRERYKRICAEKYGF